MKNNICIKCGQHRDAIRKHGLICGSVDPQSGELIQEFGRHRFTPLSKKEIEVEEKAQKEWLDWHNSGQEEKDWLKFKAENNI